jgi:hypothetical protein
LELCRANIDDLYVKRHVFLQEDAFLTLQQFRYLIWGVLPQPGSFPGSGIRVSSLNAEEINFKTEADLGYM